MKIAIIGYGKQGQAAYDYWHHDNQITICDSNEALMLPEGVATQLGPDYLNNLARFDLIVRSPIIHPSDLVAAAGESVLEKVTTVTNEFFKVSPTRHLIGVTGTKGKGTTSTLIAKMLEATGHRVHLGGNIGIPPLEHLKDDIKPDDWVVLELANFQLIDLKYSPPIAVCLMVHPEHLDWHKDLAEYIEAKSQLFRHQTKQDVAIYYAENTNSKQVINTSPGQHIPYMTIPGAFVKDNEIVINDQVVCRTDELKLLGQHNWQNVCAALTAVWQISQDIPALRSVLTSFTGLPFRLELRREVNQIRYYNDSFSSGPPSTLAAIEAIPDQKVMIIGGFDRHLDIRDLSIGLSKADHIRKVLLIGASAKRAAESLESHGFNNFVISDAQSMNEIVAAATRLAQPGDAILLSPGFASFDMFKNFEDRGLQFNRAVEQL